MVGESTLTVDNCEFDGSKASLAGGLFYGSEKSITTMSNIKVRGSHSTTGVRDSTIL